MRLLLIGIVLISSITFSLSTLYAYDTEAIAPIYNDPGLTSENFLSWNYLEQDGKKETDTDAFDKNSKPNPDAFYKVFYDSTGSTVIKVEKYSDPNNIEKLALYEYNENNKKLSKIKYLEQEEDCVSKRKMFKTKEIDELSFQPSYIKVSRYRQTNCRTLSLISMTYYNYSWKKNKDVQVQGNDQQWMTYYYKNGNIKKVIHYSNSRPAFIANYNKNNQMESKQFFSTTSKKIRALEKYAYNENGNIYKKSVYLPLKNSSNDNLKLAEVSEFTYNDEAKIEKEYTKSYDIDGKIVKALEKTLSDKKFFDSDQKPISEDEYKKIACVAN